MIKFIPILKVINAQELKDNKEEVEKQMKETQKLIDKKIIFLNWSNKFTDFSAT